MGQRRACRHSRSCLQRGGDKAGKRTSISAHPLPFPARPAELLGEGRCYLPPASLAGARLLRRASRGSGPAAAAAVPGVRLPAARLNPPAGPPPAAVYQHRQPAHDSASSGCSPASSRHPGIAATAAGTVGTLGGMLPQTAEGSRTPPQMTTQAGRRFSGQGNHLPSFQARSAPASEEVTAWERLGFACATRREAARGHLPEQRAFSNQWDDAKQPQRLLLPAPP